MNVQHIAAFSSTQQGGNPAGVVLCEVMPSVEEMQALAASVGYSETAFAAPVADRWRVRYFAPQVEVDFCGHATIALGAVLARHKGPGLFALELNHADISVEGHLTETEWGAALQSPPTRSGPVAAATLDEALALFGFTPADLDARIPPAVIHGGGDHLVLALKDRKTLREMRYDLEKGRALATREGYITFNLVYAETPRVFHARNPFPLGGVYEDPATGAAAAALAGYLRDLDWPHEGSIIIHQGEDMGVPSRLQAEITPERGASIRVSGAARFIHESQNLENGGMAMTPEQKLSSLGLVLPEPPTPLAQYRPVRQVGNTLYLSGQIPRNPDGSFILGRLGRDTSVEAGYAAARNVGLQLLSVAKAVVGDLSRIEAVAKVTGMVNAEPDFFEHASVINGCSDLLIDVLGEAGYHARSAVGMGSLPFGVVVEIEAIFAVKA